MAAAAIVGTAMLGVASSAGATTLTFYGSYDPDPAGPNITYDATDDRGSLVCSGSCEGLLSDLASGVYAPDVPDASTADGFSSTDADLFNLENSSLASETDFVNTVTGSSFLTGTKTDPGVTSFTSSAEYILFKIGEDPDYALIHNTTANNLFDYTAFIASGAGLSHFTEFGVVSAIPLPASLLLLLSGLGGLGFLNWRSRAVAA